MNDPNLGAEHGEKHELLITYLRHKFVWLLLDYTWLFLTCFMAFGWYYPKVGKNTSTIYDPLNSLGWCLDCIWPIKKLKNVGMVQ